MAEVINLRMARKAKARADKAREATTNRALHGEDKASRAARKAAADRAARQLDGHQRVPD